MVSPGSRLLAGSVIVLLAVASLLGLVGGLVKPAATPGWIYAPAPTPAATSAPADTAAERDDDGDENGRTDADETAILSGNASDPEHPFITWAGTEPWQLQRVSHESGATEAYADAPSYLAGSTVRLAVSTVSASYTVSIWRIGATFAHVLDLFKQRSVPQPAPTIDPATLEVRAGWRYTSSFVVPASWPTGIYLAKVAGSGGDGTQSYATFVVRDTKPHTYRMVVNTLTWQAYNEWGGASLYVSKIGEVAPGVLRATKVSFDRPYDDGGGAGRVFRDEAPFGGWLERNGYDVGYTTEYDLSVDPLANPPTKVLLFAGHSEYWSIAMRDYLDAHVLQRGDLSLGAFAANTGYWPVTLTDPGSTGPRTIVCYRDAVLTPGDPIPDPRYSGGGPKVIRFRELPWGDPDPGNRPEQALFGTMYGYVVGGTDYYPMILGKTTPAWLLAGTGLRPGDSLGALAGGEVDFVHPNALTDRNDRIVAQAQGFPTTAKLPGLSQAVTRDLPSGARVFAAGTFWWPWGLDPEYAALRGVPAGFVTLERNILTHLAQAPARPGRSSVATSSPGDAWPRPAPRNRMLPC